MVGTKRGASVKVMIGLALCFVIGVGCRLTGIPLPAPQALIGALLVVAMTAGYVGMDRLLLARARAGRP